MHSVNAIPLPPNDRYHNWVDVVVAPLIQDIRYTLRLGRKSPGFVVCVILLLALGIGLNSAIFTLLDALLLRPLPVRKPRELVRLVQVAAPLGPRSFFTYNTYRALAQGNRSFTRSSPTASRTSRFTITAHIASVVTLSAAVSSALWVSRRCTDER